MVIHQIDIPKDYYVIKKNNLYLSPGVYRREDGEIFRVRITRDRSKVYSEKWVLVNREMMFRYDPNALSTLTMEMILNLKEARKISLSVGQCIACSKILTNLESQKKSIGPICEKNWEKFRDLKFKVKIDNTFESF